MKWTCERGLDDVHVYASEQGVDRRFFVEPESIENVWEDGEQTITIRFKEGGTLTIWTPYRIMWSEPDRH